MREIDFCRGTETLAVIVSVDMCALVCCRVGAKRVKSMTRTKKQYYKVMQAKRQREVSDIANGILIRHVLCCFNLFLLTLELNVRMARSVLQMEMR